MLRTQIYLPEYEYKRLKAKARREEKTLAQTVRELLRIGFEKEKETKRTGANKKKLSGGEFLLSLARLGDKLNVDLGSDASLTIDEVVYGLKKSK